MTAPDAPPPYRLTPQRISPSHARAGVADPLLAQAQTVLPYELDPETIGRWLQFPDERVACAVIRTYRTALVDLRVQDRRAWDFLLARAVAEAVQDRVFWTPLLDTLLIECPHASKHSAPELAPLLRGLRRWAAGQDADDLIPMLGFEYVPVHETCLQATPTPAFVAVVARRSPTLLPALARHPDLDAPTANSLALHSAQQLITYLKLPEPTTEELNSQLRCCSEALRVLDESGHAIPGTVVDYLVSEVRLSISAGAHALTDELISVLLQLHESVTPSQLRVVATVFPSRRHVGFAVSDLLRHPSSGPLWRELAEAAALSPWPDQRILRALGSHPKAVRDPHVRELLAASTDQHVQRSVLPFLEPQRFAELFDSFVERGEVNVTDVSSATGAQLAALTEEHWRPMFKLYSPGYTSEVLIHIPSARQNALGRRHLLSSSRVEILAALCREDEATPDECGQLLAAIADRSPAIFATMTEREALMRSLSPGHLVPMLTHRVARIRELALVALGRLTPTS